MRLSERILLLLSRAPEEPDLLSGTDEWTPTNALDLLRRAFPDFDERISGRGVLDFGCGDGYQCVAMAKRGAKYVLGVDTSEAGLAKARALADQQGVRMGQVEFSNSVPLERAGTFDVVVSQNSFEHFPDPASTLSQMTTALRPGGVMLITFGPPWFAPYGSHMFFFTKLPWINLLFSEKTVMRVRSRFRSDGATRYEEVERGLNKMTVARFERLVHESGLCVAWKRYRCVKGLDFLAAVPDLRELAVNMITVVLTKSG